MKIAIKNANLCRKNMRYVHFAEICENVAVMYSEMSGEGKKLVWQWAGMDVKGTNGD